MSPWLCLQSSISIIFLATYRNRICTGLRVESLIKEPRLKPACLVPQLLSARFPHMDPTCILTSLLLLFSMRASVSSSSYWLRRLTGTQAQPLWSKCPQSLWLQTRQGLCHALGCRVCDLSWSSPEMKRCCCCLHSGRAENGGQQRARRLADLSGPGSAS